MTAEIQAPAPCMVNNGTYCCELPAGHPGYHIGRVSFQGKLIWKQFRDGYSVIMRSSRAQFEAARAAATAPAVPTVADQQPAPIRPEQVEAAMRVLRGHQLSPALVAVALAAAALAGVAE